MLSKTKAKILAKEYINNDFNATETIKKIEPNIKNKTAGVKASRMLESVVFQKSLAEVMEEQGINNEIILREHKKVLVQDKHLPSKNTAIDMFYKLQGSYAPEKKLTLNINTNDPEAINKRIADIKEELRLLNNG